jgi:hypothetical protein
MSSKRRADAAEKAERFDPRRFQRRTGRRAIIFRSSRPPKTLTKINEPRGRLSSGFPIEGGSGMVAAAGGGHSPDEGGKQKKRSIRNILDEFHKNFRFYLLCIFSCGNSIIPESSGSRKPFCVCVKILFFIV